MTNLHLRLRQRLVLYYVIFAAGILALVSGLAWYSGRKILRDAATSNLVLTATQNESTIQNWFLDRQKEIISLSTAIDFQKDLTDFVTAPDSAVAQTAHGRLLAQFKPRTGEDRQFLAMFLLDPTSGQVIAATDPTTERQFWQDQPYFIHGKIAPTIEGPADSMQFQGQTIIMAGPVRDPDGLLLGVLAARVNLSRVSIVILRRSNIHETDDSFLVNSSGQFVTSPRFASTLPNLQQSAHARSVEQCVPGENAVLTANDYRGIPSIVVYRWLSERQVCLVVQQTQAEIVAPLAGFEQTILIVGSLVLLMAFLLAIGLARTITRPILTLQSGAMRFGNGELNLRLPETTHDELGALAHAFNVMADAIIRKEAQLVQSAAEYATLMDRMPDAIYFKDTASRFTRLNQAQAQNLGASGSEQALGKTDFDFQARHIAQNSYAEEQRLMKTGQPILNRIEFNPTPDGQDRWFSCTKAPIKDIDGNIIGLVGISRNVTDITEQKINEEVVIQSLARLTREQEARAEAEAVTERLTFLLEASTLVAESFDYVTRLQQLAQQIVPRLADWCAIEVLAENGTLQRVAVVHVDPAKVALAFELARRFPPDPKAPRGAHHVLCTGQSELYAEIPDSLLAVSIPDPELLALTRQLGFKSAMSVPLLAHGQALGVITLVMSESNRRFTETDLVFVEELARRAATLIENARLHDETQRLNTDLEERVIQRTAQLEAANKELEAFSYSVSHDLRSPLRAIDGFSRILVRDYGSQLPPDAQRRLASVRENAQQMGKLIDDLLAFSHLGRQKLTKQAVALTDLTKQALQGLVNEQETRDIQVIIADLPVCDADPALLKLVLINLLTNAIKFTRQRDVPRIEVGSQLINGVQAYFVKDNGVGFDMQYYDKLFGVFQRLHRAEDFEGTGVGLAIVQRIIRSHGGRVWAEGQVDSGATFYFTLGGEDA